MKDKAIISPSVIIAKVQIDWPGKTSSSELVGNIDFGYGSYGGASLFTPPPSSSDIAGKANFGNATSARQPHFGPIVTLCSSQARPGQQKQVQGKGRGLGRGNGYMRGGRVDVLEVMSPDHPNVQHILRRYRIWPSPRSDPIRPITASPTPISLLSLVFVLLA